jgi:dTDP-4-amino-4,6-dideoxygalactose transaminase
MNGIALLGGDKAFAEPLHVGRPNLGDTKRFLARVEESLNRRWLSNDGPLLHEFEEKIKAMLGVEHAVVVNNATIGIELALRACCGVGEIIVPSYTFVATAHAALWCGYTPVFADVDPVTHHLTVESVKKCITSKTVAIMPVHLWGACVAAPELEALAAEHGLALLFDAAHAYSTQTAGRKVGNWGAAEVFSFHATKFVNSGEGGAITTNDADLAQRMRLMRNFGFMGYDNVVTLGTNAKMNEFSAAMGLTCLEALPGIISRNHANWLAYRNALESLPGLSFYLYDPSTSPNYQYVILQVDEALCPLTRDEIVAVLHEENVFARKYFYPGVHRMEPYRSRDPQAGERLPNTELLTRSIFALPTGTAVNEADISKIGERVSYAMAHAAAVKTALAGRPVVPPPVPVLPAHMRFGATV